MSKSDFTKGGILKPLVEFTFPVLLALCLQSLYGAVDLMVVGRFGDAADVSAVSTGTQILHTLTAIIMGLSMGTTVLIARSIGEKREDRVGNIIGAGIALFAAIAVVMTVVMQFAAAPFTRLMQAPVEAFDKAVSYVRICTGGAVFIVGYNVLGSVFRGLGDSRTPLLAVGIACVCNIVGDLLLVGVFGMAAAGAALATVLSQAISVVLCLVILKRRGLPFPFSVSCIRFDRQIIGETVKVGAPIALQDTLVSISFLALLAIVNSLGVIISAGVGVAERICGFIMLLPSAFMQSLSAFVAQNAGAGRMDRARRALLYGILTSLGCSLILAWFSFFHGDILASIFASSEEVIQAGAEYLKAYAIDTLLVSFMFCFCGYFNGLGRTRFVMLQGICGAFGVRIPVSYIMSRQNPVSLFHVGLATPSSTVVQIILCVIYFLALRKNERETPIPQIES